MKHNCCCFLVDKLCRLFHNYMDCSPQNSSLQGISQATVPEWVAIFFSRESSWPRDQTLRIGQEATVRTGQGTVDWLKIGKEYNQGYILSPSLFNLYADLVSSVAQSCPTLCDPMDCSMPGFPVHHQLPEYIIWNFWLGESQAGIQIAGRNINNLRYRDDIILTVESEEELKSNNNSVSLIIMSISMTIPCCFDYCSFLTLSEVWNGYASSFIFLFCFLFFPDCFGKSGSKLGKE